MTSMGLRLASPGLAQLLLATIVFASYAFALGELVGFRGRARAAIVGLIAAAGLAGTAESWEVPVMILGSVPLITGLFAFTAWVLWKVSPGATRRPVTLAPDPLALGLESQKARNLAQDNRVSITIDHDTADMMAITGLSMAARAHRVSDRTEAEKVLRMLPLKYLDAPPATAQMKMPAQEDVAIFRLVPEIISVLDYTKGFAHTDLVTG